MGSGKAAPRSLAVRLWVRPPTRWRLRGPFHDTRGKAYRNETGELKKKAPTAYTSHPGGREARTAA